MGHKRRKMTMDRSLLLLPLYCAVALWLIRFQQTPPLEAMESLSTQIRSALFERIAAVSSFFQLREQNDRLALQNAMLLERELSLRNTFEESSARESFQGFTGKGSHSFITARIVDRRYDAKENLLLIDKGSSSGIAENMAVVTPDGLVGRVISVATNYAKVMPVIHADFSVSGISALNGTHGLLQWQGGHESTAMLRHVPSSSTITEGERILTTDYSTFVLRGIPLGTVASVEHGSQFHTVTVDLAVDFSRLSHVLVSLQRPDPRKPPLNNK
ncbi:rod shape-determining protein MreC [Prosthecochloris sp. CIB 2401]|uniref:rod shape-determining protein MreC n=1 Tax=Prosthecochloris sp. CIB 2401 TaxID=1868325 RepID=UPI00080AB247|nr:rod shape-determining protein MreC [Prosthecochloris sp. CIB 2401]ANT65362.1 Rod shape-determining protein MreC [Prosthecochloris sp. CIB 2401]